MFNFVRGDLLDPDVLNGLPVHGIAHGTNLTGGAIHGVAALIFNEYPEAYEEYINDIGSGLVEPGDITITEYHSEEDNSLFTIYNLFTQVLPGPDAKYFYLADSLKALAFNVREGETVVLPLIGGGIGGLNPEACFRITHQILSEAEGNFVMVLLPDAEFKPEEIEL